MKVREIRKQGNQMGWSIMVYTVILNAYVMMGMVIDIIVRIFQRMAEAGAAFGEADVDMILEESLDQMMESGTSSIVAIGAGILALALIFRNRITITNMWESKKKMTPQAFFKLLSVFMMGQIVFSVVGSGIEAGLNAMGYSATQQLEWVSSTSETVSMFLYVSIAGPIAEEIVYRGFVMKNLSKYGKHFAIVCAAVMFGFMHANVYQMFFAIVVGLVLGYVASEYSLKWAIILHIVNNCIFSELLGMLIKDLPEWIQNLINYVILGAFFIAAVVIMWRHRQDIKTYYQEHRVEKKQYLRFFTSLGMIVFVVAHVIMTLMGIAPIQ